MNKWTSSKVRPLIALQEVTGEWKDDMEKILLNNGYNNFSMNYGYNISYYIILLIVAKEYTVLKINYINIGDLIKESNLLEEELFVNNFIIELILKDRKPFIFYNNHLPVPKINNSKLIEVLTIRERMCNMREYSIIWAGDFNIKPNSDIYNLILNSEFENCNLKLESSYKSFHGSEPIMTTHTKNFKDTLDYIFITKNIKCIYSKILQYNHLIMPNKYNPSDHLPLISFLILK